MALHCLVWYGSIFYGTVGFVFHGAVWFGIPWCSIGAKSVGVSCSIVQFGEQWKLNHADGSACCGRVWQ